MVSSFGLKGDVNMSAEIKLQAGQWYRDGQGDIVYCIGFNPCQDTTIRNYSWMCCTKDTHVRYYTGGGKFDRLKQCFKDIVEHLPDCDSFDWVPPKRPNAPEGWRWLEDDEKIQGEDCYWAKKYNNGEFADDKASCYIGKTWIRLKHLMPWAWGVVRKIEPPQPKYRPFKDAEEFKPYRDEWFCDLNNPQFRTKVTAYDHRYVWFAGANVGESYLDAFKTRLREDGSEFGVLDDGT